MALLPAPSLRWSNSPVRLRARARQPAGAGGCRRRHGRVRCPSPDRREPPPAVCPDRKRRARSDPASRHLGQSTLPVLRAAWQSDVPFIHLGGGIFQLGWGARARRIDRSTTDGDPATAAKLAQNKIWTASLLRNAGLPTPQHQVVTTLEAARLAVQRLGWPVVLKPADRDRGEGVSVNVADEANLQRAFAIAQKASRARQVIVERQVAGVCHRLFIAGGRLLYAVIRWPKSVHGDGCRSVAELIRDANAAEAGRPPWRRSEPFPADAEAVAAMAAAGYALDTIPDAGARVPLRAIESTAGGGFDEEVTDRIHPDNLDIALRATALFGLEVAGIDIITSDIGTPWHANGAIINEVNYAPLLGGGEISRRHVPEFLQRLLGGNGRIPVEAFVGGESAMAAARQGRANLRIRNRLLSDQPCRHLDARRRGSAHAVQGASIGAAGRCSLTGAWKRSCWWSRPRNCCGPACR